MPKTAEKEKIKVTVDIRSGPATPATRAQWHKAWRKLVSEARK